jgi:hypothetical protein
METIDSTTLFCRDIQNIDVTGEGTLTDNSGNKNYANNSACKWQLVAPAGKKIRIEVDQIDTQPNIDYLWFFDGTSTLVENLLAKFSGSNKPPEITSLSDHLLLWFVTDKGTTGKGWSLRYKVVD